MCTSESSGKGDTSNLRIIAHWARAGVSGVRPSSCVSLEQVSWRLSEGDRLSSQTSPNCPVWCFKYLDVIATARDLAPFDRNAITLLAVVAKGNPKLAREILRIQRIHGESLSVSGSSSLSILCRWVLARGQLAEPMAEPEAEPEQLEA